MICRMSSSFRKRWPLSYLIINNYNLETREVQTVQKMTPKQAIKRKHIRWTSLARSVIKKNLPARNFVCEGCLKRGNSAPQNKQFHLWSDIDAWGICNKEIQCTAIELNCAYCSVKGDLSHVYIERRLDVLWY